MGKSNLVNDVKCAGAFLGEAMQRTIVNRENQLYNEVTDLEFSRGLHSTVAALADVSNDGEAITASLMRYWGIARGEAESLVRHEMREHLPIRRLISYLKSEKNYSPLEAKEFIESHGLPAKLIDEPGLSAMKPEQLYEELEKSS